MCMELLNVITKTIQEAINKFPSVLSTFWGRISSLIVFICTWFVGWMGDTREVCLYFVIGAILLDLGWGMASSFKRGTFALSLGFTKTCIKIAVYSTILTLVTLGEKAIADDWNIMFRITSAVLIVAESISICGHILIIKPDTPVIKVLWRLLRSEVAKKLGVEVADVDNILKELTQTNANINQECENDTN